MKKETGMRRGVGTGRAYKNNNDVAAQSNRLSWFLFGLVLGLFSSLFLILYFNGFEANKGLLVAAKTPVVSDFKHDLSAGKLLLTNKGSSKKSINTAVVNSVLTSGNKSLPDMVVEKTKVIVKPKVAAQVANKGLAPEKVKVQARPKYEFYNVLKNDAAVPVKVSVSHVAKQQSEPLAAGYYLKVASLRNEKDAEGLKAKLLLQGYNVTIKKVSLDSVLWSRIIVGPFDTIKEAYNTQSSLRSDSLNAVLVKSDTI